MPNTDHDHAQHLSAQAELAHGEGDRATARRLYEQAADHELKALHALPADKARSRGILSVSHAALLFKAALYDRAETAICGLLADHLDLSHREQLKELLQATWEEQLLAQEQMRSSGAEILIALRGGRIGSGTAPADTAVHYLNGINFLAFRVAELEAGLDLRRQGPPPREIRSAFEARATQPVGGSYRFAIRFVEPIQRSLFPETAQVRTPDPQRVSKIVKQVFRAIERNNPATLDEAVQREDYRLALVRLARNVIPAGDALAELEVRTAGDSPTEAVYLRPEQRRYASEEIRRLSPVSQETESEPVTIVGTLRALNLDRAWLEIRSETGEPVRVKTGPNELDDVIGPMVNRRVSARVQQYGRARRLERRVLDIELVED
jgi:hypothetical protein